jgi:uncharacterized protein YqfA (UPF0365 family)
MLFALSHRLVDGWILAAAGPGSDDFMKTLKMLGLIALACLGLVVLLAFFTFGKLYIRALLSGCRVPLLNLIGMRFRNVNPQVIVDAKVISFKAGLNVSENEFETHYLANGNVLRVVNALVAASKADIKLNFERACAIDLAGRNVLEAVKTSVNPKVIEVPERGTIDAVAKDGIQVRATARVTVRTNIDQLVGGATEATIVARVGEGIVSTIGSSASYETVLENPDMISKTVLAKGLDAGTAFEILSIDIADVDVGENIGAKLQTDQAAADLKIARAKAEERRAMAVAAEQEQKAQIHANRAKVVLAEAEVPKAIAQAFREGNLGVMDYLQIKNIQADTEMRRGIGGAESDSGARA